MAANLYSGHNNKKGQSYCDHSLDCFSRMATVYCGDYVIVLAIPLFEFVLCPLLRLHHFNISTLKKAFIGMFLAILCVASATSVVFVAQWKNQTVQNETCPAVEADVKSTINYRWMSIPYALESTMQLIAITSGASCPDSAVDEVLKTIASLFEGTDKLALAFERFLEQAPAAQSAA